MKRPIRIVIPFWVVGLIIILSLAIFLLLNNRNKTVFKGGFPTRITISGIPTSPTLGQQLLPGTTCILGAWPYELSVSIEVATESSVFVFQETNSLTLISAMRAARDNNEEIKIVRRIIYHNYGCETEYRWKHWVASSIYNRQTGQIIWINENR